MRIAAIDCGSNSFHLLIADTHGHDQIEVIEDDKSLLYLGAEVATTGKISSAALTRARRVIRHYRNLISRHEVDIVRCIATSAIRSAENGSYIIQALSKSLGQEIRVISGKEEAQTIFRAISTLTAFPETRMLGCDMGGGSLELMVGQRSGLEYARSYPLGASRLAAALEVGDPLSNEDIENIVELCHTSFKEFSVKYPKELFSHIVVSSGTLTSLVTLARARVDGFISSPTTVLNANSTEIRDICEILIHQDKKQRLNLLGYDKTRDAFLPTAAQIAKEIINLGSKDCVWMTSPYALREGLILKTADKYISEQQDPMAISNKSFEDLIERLSHVRTAGESKNKQSDKSAVISHGEKVADLSLSLFDALKPLHNLDNSYRRLLSFAARIHDIGESISHAKHDQHGAYIISNISLAGFSPEETKLLRGLIRWHRSRDPRETEQYVGKMNGEERDVARWLTGILRIADGADAGKSNLISQIELTVNPDVIFMRFISEEDCELELYSTRQKRALLEVISGRDIIIEQKLIGLGSGLD